MEDEDPLLLELQLLEASYGDELQISDQAERPLSISFRASPHVASQPSHIFTGVTLHITIASGYPSTPATFEMSNARGLDDEQLRALREALAADAAKAAASSDIHVSQAISSTESFLTARNAPNRCPVCFEGINSDGTGDMALLRLEPCFHAIHLACYENYAKALVERRQEKERTLRQREGSSRAKRLAAVNWAICPICRRDFSYDLASSHAATARMRMTLAQPQTHRRHHHYK